MAKAKSCKRAPKANVFIKHIPPGAPIYDCGRYYVAKLTTGPAVVNWEGRDASEAQSRLRRAAIRGTFAGFRRRRRRRSR